MSPPGAELSINSSYLCVVKIFENISLRNLNSFGVEACAARLVEWESPQELSRNADGELISSLTKDPWLALGGGNNILFTRDFDGTLVKSAARKIEVTAETPKTLSVRAESGTDWDYFVSWCIANNAWGAENLSGIPGSVGAAPIQNIGAYGAEAKDIIHSVECFSIDTGVFLTLAAEHCAFGYRDSVFKRQLRGRVIITAVNFILSKKPRPNLHYAALAEKVAETGSGEPTLQNISQAVISIRNSKLPDPKKIGNAGSFFKNPIVDTNVAHEIAKSHPEMPLYPCAENHLKTKLAAGWLIEAAGWRGKTDIETGGRGRVGIHPCQALVVINNGGATGSEIVSFAQEVQQDIKSKFGVSLEIEVNIC